MFAYPASLDLLRSRINRLKAFEKCPPVYSIAESIAESAGLAGCFDIIANGEFIWQLNQWIHDRNDTVRVWTLSERHRQQLMTEAGFRADEVTVVPRHLIFKERLRKPSQNINRIVFAGRANLVTKRLCLMIKMVAELRKITKRPLTFEICGVMPRASKTSPPALKALPQWVIFHGNLGPNWPEHFSHAAFLSLSQYEFEDCGVSAGQAIEFGMPVVLSDWGGHHEYRTYVQALLVPALPSFTDSAENIHIRTTAPRVDRFLFGKLNSTRVAERGTKALKLIRPKPVSLQKIRSRKVSGLIGLFGPPTVSSHASPQYGLISKYFCDAQ